jgi:hypothetical protein
VLEDLVQRHATVHPSKREGEAGAGGGERLEPERRGIRADPASQGFGMTNASPACKAWNSAAFRSCLVIGDAKNNLARRRSGHDAH